jgi:hypothetical protein
MELSPNDIHPGEDMGAPALTDTSPDASCQLGSRYTHHEVLIDSEYELYDSEGSRAFVRFLQAFIVRFSESRSAKEALSFVTCWVMAWELTNKGDFRERRPEGSTEGPEWVVASNRTIVKAATKCFVGLRKAARKVRATRRVLWDRTDESVLDAFWNDKWYLVPRPWAAEFRMAAISAHQIYYKKHHHYLLSLLSSSLVRRKN